MIWMILFWMFVVFEIEVLEVPGGFRVWFQQSFYASKSSILQFGWGMDRRPLKQNYNESLAMSLLEILCSSCVLHLRRFVVEILQGFVGLNLQRFTNLWFLEVSEGLWAWFQWTLRSRKMIGMILFRMFFVFEVEVLKVPRGFRAWFQQSFYATKSSLMLLEVWMCWCIKMP